ncbi:unnamed protein product [Blepharisma stoltei]|uniref:Uncharacterized protein n=1 Tax=Blepharisma stoltei TaxID=1481888 RepID=A0AAU9J8C2_9CILI|nr:unnamed protein product [Blepharisma stoltei]
MLPKTQSKIESESSDSAQAISIMTIGRRESRDALLSVDNYQSVTNENTTESMITLIGALKPRPDVTVHPTENSTCCLFPFSLNQQSNCSIF